MHRHSSLLSPRSSAALLLLLASAIARPVASQVAQQAARPAEPATFTASDALDITTVTVADLSDDGHWVALTQSVRRDGYGNDYSHDGDPTYVHPTPARLWVADTRTGQRTAVFPDKRGIRGARFSPDGAQLAVLVWNGDVYEPVVWNRATGKVSSLKMPAGKYVAENSDVRWSAAGTQLVVAVHSYEWRTKSRETFANITKGPVFVQDSKDPFLAWDALRRGGQRRSVGSLDVKTAEYQELVPEMALAAFTLAEDGSAVSWAEDQTKKTEYDVAGADSKLVTRTQGGVPRTLLASTRGANVVWAEDGKRYAYAKNGRVYVASIADTASRMVAGPPESGAGAPADTGTGTGGRGGRGGGAARADRFTPTRFSPRGDALLLSNREGQWLVDLTTNARDLVVAGGDSNTALPRTTLLGWSSDGSQLYFTSASRTKWERAIVRYDRGTKQRTEVAKDGRTYGGLRFSKDGSVAFLTVTEGNRPADVYTADGTLAGLHRFAESNPQLAAKRIGPTDLLTYLDADGHTKHAVLHYPADYQKGTPLPTVFLIYEDFFDDTFDPVANILAGAGYLVVKPGVDFETGYPGEAWLKGVTAAANKLIELGIADSTKLGVQGQSYGGYATNLLITQTKRFKAAVNISGKVDIISFYTDSPRLGVRNITAAERDQDRIGATLWEQPQKYVQHSAVMFADRIQTPLMLITGTQDSNVPADNTREMYYALRRLGKEVVWVNYFNGGHGGGNATVDDALDMYRRMIGWYDVKLKGKPAAKTATEDRSR